MTDSRIETRDGAPRRSLFGRLAGAVALGVAGFASSASRAQSSPAAGDGPDWPGALKGRHRQVFDAYAISRGGPLAYAHTFVATTPGAGGASAVLILRDAALVIAMNDAIWDKYQIGAAYGIIDPETKANALKNPFLHPKPGVLRNDDSAIDRLIADGVITGACNVALHGHAKFLGGKIGIGADDAAKEWAANVIPGITILPSGVWGTNRAQEAGCTYCAGG